MQYRKRANKRYDRKVFSRTADKIKAANFVRPMRGGIRL